LIPKRGKKIEAEIKNILQRYDLNADNELDGGEVNNYFLGLFKSLKFSTDLLYKVPPTSKCYWQIWLEQLLSFFFGVSFAWFRFAIQSNTKSVSRPESRKTALRIEMDNKSPLSTSTTSSSVSSELRDSTIWEYKNNENW